MLFLKSPSHDGPGFPKLPTAVHSSIFLLHMRTGTLTFFSVMLPCAFKWQSTGILFFFCFSGTSLLLITHAVVGFLKKIFFPFCTFQNHLSFKPRVPHSYPEWWKRECLLMLAIASHSNQPILSLFISKQKVLLLLLGTWNASLAVQWRIFFSPARGKI